VLAVPEPGPAELHLRLELADSPELWLAVEADPELEAFRAAVRRRLGAPYDIRHLLERQRRINAAARTRGAAREAENGRLVLTGAVGGIAPMTCVELVAWREQARRFPMFQHPTEFGAFVLRRESRVRLYFSGADRMGGRIRQEVTGRVRSDVAKGWVLVAHLHNHPFLFERRVGDRLWTTEENREDIAGAVAPSLTDVHFYRNLRQGTQLREIWVTNGFETFRAPAADLGRLEGWP
jgi:hypothetical protein